MKDLAYFGVFLVCLAIGLYIEAHRDGALSGPMIVIGSECR